MTNHRHTWKLACAALVAASSLLAQGGKPAASYKDLRYPPLNKVRVPEPARFQLSNGIKVFLVEDHELPTVGVAAMIRAGGRWEPANKAGVASITGSAMRTGGSTSEGGDALDQELDRMGARVETWISGDSGGAQISALKNNADRALTILADILQHPAFPQDKIDLAIIAERASIARRNDEPMGIAGREFNRVIYGKDSPYIRQTEYDTLAAITRDDLVSFHKQYYQPENVILGAWGDFNSADMRAKIEKAFGGWDRGGHPRPEVPPVDPAARNRAGIYAINKEDVNQSTVIIGRLGGRRDDPDYYALTVMNSVLGGGFASRLFSQVRSEQGLAYAVGSAWAADYDHPGIFLARGGTKSETTVKIIQAIKHEVDRLAQGPVTDDELVRAKDGILKGTAFDYDSTGKIVNRLMTYEYFGYPQDYLQKYENGIRAVTKTDVERVAKQYMKSDEFAVLVLGKEKDFDQPLSSLGKVTPFDITIPKPKEKETAAATPENAAKGKALLAAALKASGGDAVKAVKDISMTFDLTVSAPQGEFAMKGESNVNFGGKLFVKMTNPMGEITQGYDGQVAWTRTPQGVQEAPASARTALQSRIFGDSLSILQRLDAPGMEIQAIGKSGDLEGVAVSDSAHGVQAKFFVDPKTGLLVRKISTTNAMGSSAEVEETYDDFREVNGVKLSFHAVSVQGGKKVAEQKISALKINPGIDEAAYKKP